MISADDFAAIDALDLDPIKGKLMHKDAGKGWSMERTNAVEREYRRFLYLMKMFPNEPTAPLVDVDKFWHNHILDTMKYAADCQQVFGYFLHHFPYVGLRGKEDEEALARMGERMREVYEGTFGERYPSAPLGGEVQPRTAMSAGIRVGQEPADRTAMGAKRAFCFSPPNAKPAFCFSPPRSDTAFCFSPPPRVETAFCFSPPPRLETAFCYAPGAQAAHFVPEDTHDQAFHSKGGALEYTADFYSNRPRLPA